MTDYHHIARVQSAKLQVALERLDAMRKVMQEHIDDPYQVAEPKRLKALCEPLDFDPAIASVLDLWVKTADRMPEAGQLIVKRWTNGQVWAGVYSGDPKGSSFDSWRAV